MTDILTVVPLTDPDAVAWRKDAAEQLRDYADRMERGEISEMVVVLNDRENKGFERFGHFDDRWRLLGALEYAKTVVFDVE